MNKHQPVDLLLFRLPPYPHFLKALSALLQASDEAAETGVSVWEYAVELKELHDQGVPSFTLRWLIDRHVVSQGCKEKARSGRRRFRQTSSHVFQDNSCFVLLAESVGPVRQRLLGASSAQPNRVGADRDDHFLGLPCWSKPELWYENDLVKIIPEKAPNQRKLLDHCQIGQWRQPFENCFTIHPAGDDYDPDTLHNTLVRLNANQINRRLYFYRDGSGQRFRFSVIAPETTYPNQR